MIGVYKFAAVKEKIQDLIAQGLYDDNINRDFYDFLKLNKTVKLKDKEAEFVSPASAESLKDAFEQYIADFEAAGGDKEARLLEIEAGFVEILNARLG